MLRVADHQSTGAHIRAAGKLVDTVQNQRARAILDDRAVAGNDVAERLICGFMDADAAVALDLDISCDGRTRPLQGEGIGASGASDGVGSRLPVTERAAADGAASDHS